MASYRLKPVALWAPQTNPSGHYKLHLGAPMERLLARKLTEVSHEESRDRQAQLGVLEDTSQLANFCNWRNETMQVSGEPKEYAERVRDSRTRMRLWL